MKGAAYRAGSSGELSGFLIDEAVPRDEAPGVRLDDDLGTDQLDAEQVAHALQAQNRGFAGPMVAVRPGQIELQERGIARFQRQSALRMPRNVEIEVARDHLKGVEYR